MLKVYVIVNLSYLGPIHPAYLTRGKGPSLTPFFSNKLGDPYHWAYLPQNAARWILKEHAEGMLGVLYPIIPDRPVLEIREIFLDPSPVVDPFPAPPEIPFT